MHGLVCLDADGAVIRPAILWNDQRSAPQCAMLEAGDGLERLLRLTGNRALPGFTAPKLLWMRENEPDAYARIRRICLPKDFVRDHLVGGAPQGRRRCLRDAAPRCRRSAAGAPSCCRDLDIPLGWLPDLAESPDSVGTLDGVAGRRGRRAIRLRPRSAPESRARVRSRSCSAPRAWCWPRPIASSPIREGRVHAFCHAVAGSLDGHGRDALGRRIARLVPRHAAPDVDYDAMLGEAEGVAPGCEGSPFCRTSPASGPRTRIRTRAAPSADSRSHTGAARSLGPCSRASPSRCAIASTRSGRRGHHYAGSCLGRRLEKPLWLQIVASALELPLEIMATDQGSAFGAALLGGVASGVYRDARRGRRRVRPRHRGRRSGRRLDRAVPRGSASLSRVLPGAALGRLAPAQGQADRRSAGRAGTSVGSSSTRVSASSAAPSSGPSAPSCVGRISSSSSSAGAITRARSSASTVALHHRPHAWRASRRARRAAG